MTTLAPCAARFFAATAPMPSLAPVMTTVLPLMSQVFATPAIVPDKIRA
jgi:hypothetical protein